MPAYIVTFEIDDLARRTAFIEQLKAYKTYCPINKYSWAIVTTQKASEIRDSLQKILTQSDRIFVIRSGTEAAWFNSYGTQYNDWLKRHL